MSPRPQIDHIRKPQLLAAAADVIAERGFAATRIADVAERAGTSAPSVLYWFDSRDALLDEALTHAEDTYYTELSARLASLDDPAQRLAALIDGSVGGLDWVLWIELWVRALRDPDLGASRARLDVRWRAEIERIVVDGQARGVFAGPDPERAALEIAALIDGLAVQVALEDPVVTGEMMRQIALDVAGRLLEAELVVPVAEVAA